MNNLYFVILFTAVSMCNAVHAMQNNQAFRIQCDDHTSKKSDSVIWDSQYQTPEAKIEHLALESEKQKIKIKELKNKIRKLSPKPSIWANAPKAHTAATIAGIFGGFFGFACICPAALPITTGMKIGLSTATSIIGCGAVIGNRENINKQHNFYKYSEGKDGMSHIEMVQDVVKPIVKAAAITSVVCLGALGAYHLRKLNVTFMSQACK
ncbi:MAG TPA: hypothetical protein VGW78_06140 [Candidatus Babeliales bacterium]|jgi:hypothetical protein|nr:hypothetical protein [Candidatus Babeliales bacterium]